MIVQSTKTGSADKTVSQIKKTIRLFSGDVGALSKIPFQSFFNFVKTMPYRQDPNGREIVPRARYTLRFAPVLGRDCKKQTILICSWARENKIPYKIVVVSNRISRKPHHVFGALFLDGKWIDCDATYAKNKIGEKKQYTYRKEYEG